MDHVFKTRGLALAKITILWLAIQSFMIQSCYDVWPHNNKRILFKMNGLLEVINCFEYWLPLLLGVLSGIVYRKWSLLTFDKLFFWCSSKTYLPGFFFLLSNEGSQKKLWAKKGDYFNQPDQYSVINNSERGNKCRHSCNDCKYSERVGCIKIIH